MKDQIRKVYKEVLEAIYESMEDDEECVLDEHEIITNILEEGADILQDIAPGISIKTHKYTTVRRFELTATPYDQTKEFPDGPLEEERVGDPIGPQPPTSASDADVTNIIRSIRMKG